MGAHQQAGEGVPQGSRGETAATRRWEKATYWPLTILAFLFLFAYTAQVVGDIDGGWRAVTSTVITATWIAFAADYLVRLSLAGPRGRWFRTHGFDLAAVLVPALRPVRLLGAVARLASFSHSVGSSLRARLILYGVGSALLLIWQVSLWVLQVERDAPGASIRSFGDAVWWAFCTVTTVGYGDYVPVTPAGRFFAVVLMAGGVVLVGLIVATISSYVVERATRGHDEERAATRADVREVLDAIERRSGAASPPAE